MKTTEELNALKEKVEAGKFHALTDDEDLMQVVGGAEDYLPDESEEEASPSKYGPGSNPEYGPYINPVYGPKYKHHHHHDCYLTTACMKHLSESFDDHCHELTVLRWFRDNFVKEEDIELYYSIAPTIVESIDSLPADKQDTIYKDIYTDIVSACVELIENREYEKAYERYMNSTLALKQRFAS